MASGSPMGCVPAADSGWRHLVLALLAGSALTAQEPGSFDLGPPPTRNLFSFLQAPMVYEPQSPFLVGRGHWRFSLQEVEANVFELPAAFGGLEGAGWGLGNRAVMTRAFFQQLITEPSTRDVPFLPYADEEITRTQFQVRTGVGAATDVWVEMALESHSGGFMDPLAEADHDAFGIHVFGRTDLARNQCVLAIGGQGRILFYSQGNLPVKVQDPMLGVVHQVARGTDSGLDLMLSCKPPMTKAYGEWEAGFDLQGGLGGWWKQGHSTFLYGAAYTRRGPGNAPYQALHYTSDGGAHLGWQGRGNRRLQPFFQLYYLSGFARPPQGGGFSKASLQHDLGLHWFLTARTALTFRYVNNLTENGNTDDFQLGVGLTSKF